MPVSTQNAVDQELEARIRSKSFWSVKETADLLGISQETVRTRIKEGDLPAVQFSRAYKVTPGVLLDFLRSRTERGATASDSAA